MDAIETKVREENPDWTDEQVTAEVTKRKAKPEPPTDPPKPDERDAAFAELRRKADENEKARKAAEKKLADRERADAEAQGQWETLAKQYETERDEARKDLADLRTSIKVEGIARHLKFRNTDEALALLPANVDKENDQAVREALTDLAEERKHLVDNGAPPPSGAPVGPGGNGGLTVEQIKQMSPEEVNRRWDEIQPVLAQQT